MLKCFSTHAIYLRICCDGFCFPPTHLYWFRTDRNAMGRQLTTASVSTRLIYSRGFLAGFAIPIWSGAAFLYAWHLRGLRLLAERDPTGISVVTLYAQQWLSDWISLQRWVGGWTERFCTPAAISADVLVMGYSAHINKHSAVILASQVGAYGQWATDVGENRAATGSGKTCSGWLARSSDHATIIFQVFFGLFFSDCLL